MGLRYIFKGRLYDLSQHADLPFGKSKLKIKTPKGVETYGLTSDSSASQYSPMSYMVSGKKAWIARSTSTSSSTKNTLTRPSNSYSQTRPSASYTTTSVYDYQTTKQSWYNTYTTYYTTSSTTTERNVKNYSTVWRKYKHEVIYYVFTNPYAWVDEYRSNPYDIKSEPYKGTPNYFYASGFVADWTALSRAASSWVSGTFTLNGTFDRSSSSSLLYLDSDNSVILYNDMTITSRSSTIRGSGRYMGVENVTEYHFRTSGNIKNVQYITHASSSLSTIYTTNTVNTYRYNGNYFSSRSTSGQASQASWYWTTRPSNSYSTTSQSRYTTTSSSSYTSSNSTSSSTHNANL